MNSNQKQWLIRGLLAFGFAAVLAFELSLIPKIGNSDLNFAYLGWVDEILANGRWSALQFRFYDYNPSYIYLLILVSYLPISKVGMVILVNLVFAFAAAFASFLIMRCFFPTGQKPLIAAFAIFACPVVVINACYWGQTDIIYTFFLLMSIYFALKKHSGWCVAFFATAFTFKAQAIFLAPWLLALATHKQIRWRDLLLAIPIYFAWLAPCLIAGRPFMDLITIYFAQSQTFSYLTMEAPSLFAFVQDMNFSVGKRLGEGLALIAGLGIAVWKSQRPLSNRQILLLSAASAQIFPFLLPMMHERYFFVAAVLSILVAFVNPDLKLIPFALQAVQILSYIPFLLSQSVPLEYLAIVNLFVIIVYLVQYQRSFINLISEPALDPA